MSKIYAYGLAFVSNCVATAVLAAPMSYVIQNQSELGQVLQKYAIDRKAVELNHRTYNNPFLMGLTGLGALTSFGLCLKELSDKPLIDVPVQSAPPVNISNVNNVVVKTAQERQSRNQEYTPDVVDRNSDPYAWMESLHEINCLLIYGQQGAGKTTFIEHEVEARKALGHQILVLDPHREYGAWEGLEVVGDGKDYQAIDDELSNINSLITARHGQRSKVKGFNPKPITIICEEFTQWSVKCANSDNFFQEALSDCRKVRIHVIFVAHARTMGVLTKKAGMSAMFENGSTKLEILGKPNALGKTIPSGFADLYNTKDGKPTRVAIPDLSKKESNEIDDLFEDETPKDNVIPLRRKAS